ncbi:MAG: hypothetical protein ACFFBR_03575 [Promethearchaeota archaeon]
MRTLSVKEWIGLFLFGLLGFLLYFFGVGIIHKSWQYLAAFIDTGVFPPEFYQIPFIQGNPLGVAVLHDIGIFSASVGVIVLYIVYFVWLLPLGTPERSRRGFQYILGFLLVFIAWIGVWICMHRAFIFLSEVLRIGLFIQNPFLLHLLGLLLVGFFLLGTLGVVVYKAYQLTIASSTGSASSTQQPLAAHTVSNAPEGHSWSIPFIQIKKDWKFYFLAFLPYFSAAFAVWILLFEGFIAYQFGIPIIWALLPEIFWTPDAYMLFGGVLLIASMLGLWIIIVFVRRAPLTGTLGTSWWWQGARRYLFVLLSIIVLTAFSSGLFVISITYLQIGFITVATALTWQQIGETLVLLGLVTAFIVIVGERASEA